MTGKLSKNFHGVGIGPLSKILAVKSFETLIFSKIPPIFSYVYRRSPDGTFFAHPENRTIEKIELIGD